MTSSVSELIIRRLVLDVHSTVGTFTFGQRLGLSLIAIAASLSFCSIAWLQVRITIDVIKRYRRGTLRWPHPIFLYFYSMITSGLIQAIGSITHIKWIRLAGIIEDPYCIVQAVFRECGHPAVALANIAISYETYRIVILRRKPRSGTPVKALLIILLIWLYVLVLLGVGLGLTFVKKEGRLPFFGNTIWWCSIRAPPYLAGSLAKYTCYWAAALMSIFLYGSMAWTLYRIPKEELLRGGEDAGEAAQIARKMIFYPLMYTICILPISITRFIQFRTGHPPPFEATAFSGILIALTGFFDVVLWTWTRPELFPGNADDDKAGYIVEFDDNTLERTESRRSIGETRQYGPGKENGL